MSEFTKEYKTFFVESAAGQHLMKQIDQLVADAHEKAEANPELSRDFTQRAKGVRNVKDLIVGLGVEIKKGRQ